LTTVLSARNTYATVTRAHGSDAIRVSLQYMEALVSHNTFARAAYAGVPHAVDHLPPLKRRIFAA
jgi:hypothetical protein